MTQALHHLEDYIAKPTGMPVLVELALIHYQFGNDSSLSGRQRAAGPPPHQLAAL